MDVGMGNARIDVGVFGSQHDSRVDRVLATRVPHLHDMLFLCHRRIRLAITVLFRGAFRGTFTRAIGLAG